MREGRDQQILGVEGWVLVSPRGKRVVGFEGGGWISLRGLVHLGAKREFVVYRVVQWE